MSSSSHFPALAIRAFAVFLLSVGILSMHGFTTVATEHEAQAAAHSTAMLVDVATRIAPSDANNGMGNDMHMLAVCLWVIVASVSALGLVWACARLRAFGATRAIRTSKHPLAAFVGRSPPLRPAPVQFVVLLT